MTAFTTSPLNYPQGANTAIKRVKVERAPLTTDTKNFIPGDEWLDANSRDWWKLVDIVQGSALWVKIGGTSAAAETFTLDDSSVVGPDGLNNIILTGADGISTSGNPGSFTITIGSDGTLPNTFIEDSGSATPSGGSLNIFGQGGIATSGTGATVTIDTDGTIATKYNGDTGSAIPALGELDIVGSNLASTSATGNTVTVNSFACADIIVSLVAGQGTHTTIQSAIDDAVAGQTVWVKDGTYAGFTTKANVNVCSFSSNSVEGSATVKVKGKITSGGGSVTICGLRLETENDYAIENTAVSGMYFVNCDILADDFTAVYLNNNSGNITFVDCWGNVDDPTLKFFQVDDGDIWFYNCRMFNDGGLSTIPSEANGPFTALNTEFDFPVTVNDVICNIHNCSFECGAIDSPCLNLSGAGISASIDSTYFESGSAECITCSGAGTTQIFNCSFHSQTSFPITGNGTITGNFDWYNQSASASIIQVQFNNANSYNFQSVLNASTTNATPSDVLITPVGISNGQIASISALINGIKDDGSQGLSCELIFGARASAGTAVIVGGAVVSKNIQKDFATADVNASVATNNAYITLTGEAATNINWNIQVTTVYR